MLPCWSQLMQEGRGQEKGEGSGAVKMVSEGGESEGVRDILALWDHLVQRSHTASLNGRCLS